MKSIVTGIAALALVSATSVSDRIPTGQMVENVRCLEDPSETYTLYLPPSYTPTRRWPVLLVLDAAGRSTATAQLFQSAADRWGWILLSSDTTRSEGGQDNIDAVNALWTEVHSRWSIDPRRVYAAGFSGTGHIAYLVGKQTGGLAGVIASGSRLIQPVLEDTDYALFCAAGHLDHNYRPMLEVDRFMAEQENPHRFEKFAGPHQWMPSELASRAVAWMELVAMRRGLRQHDKAAIDSLYDADITAAAALERSGDQLEAIRRYRSIVRTFEGLRETAAASSAVRRLTADPAVQRAQSEDARLARYEDSMERVFHRAFQRLDNRTTTLLPAELRRELKIDSLSNKAERSSAEGMAARRLLETLRTHLSFYLMRKFHAEGRWRHLESVLTVALEIDERRPTTWYNLACARARLADSDGAIEALRMAIELGFEDAALIHSDPDLDSLRAIPKFATLAGDAPR